MKKLPFTEEEARQSLQNYHDFKDDRTWCKEEDDFHRMMDSKGYETCFDWPREDWRKFRQIEERRDQRLKELYLSILPFVGQVCTIIYYSDKRAATVSRIISPSRIAVRHNKTRCIDYYGADYEILQELDDDEDIFTKRKNGAWVMEGHSYKDGVRLNLAYQHHYIDPSF